jgi:hypothetical protein
MANYFIIGADGKQYGPVSGEDLRNWITEGRVGAQSQAAAEGATAWQPLSTLPEFADLFAGQAPTPASGPVSGEREAALQAVKGPAIALTVTAIIGLVLVTLGLVMNCLSLAGVQINHNPMLDAHTNKIANSFGGGVGILTNSVGAIIGVVILRGAGNMRRLENHSLAVTASVVAMIPCVSPCCLLGLPFGIWALVVLNKPEVKSQFE